MSSNYLIYNGNLHQSDELLISPDNRSFRYGDGCFETMKMINGKIVLEALHFERLFRSLEKLQFEIPDYFTTEYLQKQIQILTEGNNHQSLARIRLMIFRGDGGLYDVENNAPNYIIQSWALPAAPAYPEKGFAIDIYKQARKTADEFSAIKSNNYLPYAMAALWCKQQHLDDALVLNGYGRVAEATTSNVFIVKDNIVQTPPITEGCISGVMRRHLLHCMQQEGILYKETALAIEDVLQADEVFLTNAGFYIQWVQQCGSSVYTNAVSKRLYKTFSPVKGMRNNMF